MFPDKMYNVDHQSEVDCYQGNGEPERLRKEVLKATVHVMLSKVKWLSLTMMSCSQNNKKDVEVWCEKTALGVKKQTSGVKKYCFFTPEMIFYSLPLPLGCVFVHFSSETVCLFFFQGKRKEAKEEAKKCPEFEDRLWRILNTSRNSFRSDIVQLIVQHPLHSLKPLVQNDFCPHPRPFQGRGANSQQALEPLEPFTVPSSASSEGRGG